MKYKNIETLIRDKNKKKIFTAGPASLLAENLIGISPSFGRGDLEYEKIDKTVMDQLKSMSGHKNLVRMQGSGSLAIEIMVYNFIYGKILVIDTGYYSDRIVQILKNFKDIYKKKIKIRSVHWTKFAETNVKYDWVIACPTETSCGLKIEIPELFNFSKKIGAKLMLDATASFGLEDHHNLADVISFSSCKGLFGLTGASFISFNTSPRNIIKSFYLNIKNHENKKMTGPYHTIGSLYHVLSNHSHFKESVKINKNKFLKKMSKYLTLPLKNQPLLCTHVNTKITKNNKNVILYSPRNNLSGSVVCHLGEAHLGNKAKGDILKYLSYV